MQNSLVFSDPPGPPEIEGYETGKVVKTGDTMKLLCTSKGGNPLAQVYWCVHLRFLLGGRTKQEPFWTGLEATRLALGNSVTLIRIFLTQVQERRGDRLLVRVRARQG